MSAVAVLFGRAGSSLAGKNTRPILGQFCCVYPMLAATRAQAVRALYVSTNDPTIARAGRSLGAQVIERPAELCTPSALLEDAILHAYGAVAEREGRAPELLAVLLANAPCITAGAIDAAVRMLLGRPDLDSAATASEMPGYGPERARRLRGDTLVPAVPDTAATCDRRSTEAAYYTDQGVTVTRSRVLDDIEAQPGPFRWQGARVGLVEQPPGGGDIDHPWQFAAAEWWLREHVA